MFVVPTIAILIALGIALYRALAGPSVFDRVLAANFVGLGAIMLLAVIGFLFERPEFLDIGLVYGFLNIVGTLAILKFFRHGDLSIEEEGADGRPGGAGQ